MAYDDSRQRLVLFGGSTPTTFFGDTWEWDGTEWTQVADMGPPRRLAHTMVFDSSRECLVLFGGLFVSGSGVWTWIGDTWEWGEDAGWVKRQDMGPQSMVQPKMVHSDAHTVLFGYGQDPSDEGLTWEWNDNLWTQRQDMGPPHRTSHDLTYDSKRNRVVLFGGWGETLLEDTWELEII